MRTELRVAVKDLKLGVRDGWLTGSTGWGCCASDERKERREERNIRDIKKKKKREKIKKEKKKEKKEIKKKIN